MTDIQPDIGPLAEAGKASSDGLGRWLLGGLAGGAVLLGLLIAAYAIGYHRGEHHRPLAASPAVASTATSPTATATTVAPSLGPVTVTSALVAQGKHLFSADGCSACHSLNGTPGVGPSLKGLAGSRVALTSGQTVTASDAYLERMISNPGALVVKGYSGSVMGAAIASYNLAGNPSEIRALVAFIKSQT